MVLLRRQNFCLVREVNSGGEASSLWHTYSYEVPKAREHAGNTSGEYVSQPMSYQRIPGYTLLINRNATNPRERRAQACQWGL